jgi:hypothetical protein
MFQDSIDNYENLRQMLLKRHFPITELKGSKEKTHILYDALNDEWIVSNSSINSKIIRGESHKKVLYDSFDSIIFDENDFIV